MENNPVDHPASDDEDDDILTNEDKIRASFVNSTKVECLMNRDGDVLPYAYHNPMCEGKLVWMCGEDENGKITSVFCFDDGGRREKKCDYLENLDKAKFMRNELVKAGWLKLDPPKIEFTMPGSGSKVLNRKQRRHLAKKLREEAKKHPAPDLKTPTKP